MVNSNISRNLTAGSGLVTAQNMYEIMVTTVVRSKIFIARDKHFVFASSLTESPEVYK
jgi:hypothetical protein